MAAADLTAARLREVLHYDTATGVFTWLVSASNSVKAGSMAGSLSKIHGYRHIQLDGSIHMAHRLAVLYVSGVFPLEEVDHINGDRTDNRWSNLRCVTKAINMQNKRSAQANNVSGLLGAYFNKRSGRFIAKIGLGGVDHYIGTFLTAEEANSAYLAEKRRLHPGSTI